MPLYEYQCKKCGHRFERIQSFSAEDPKECPVCQGEVERLISTPARAHFKGLVFTPPTTLPSRPLPASRRMAGAARTAAPVLPIRVERPTRHQPPRQKALRPRPRPLPPPNRTSRPRALSWQQMMGAPHPGLSCSARWVPRTLRRTSEQTRKRDRLMGRCTANLG